MIPFIDLKQQYKLIENDVLEGIRRVLDHGHYILGEEVSILEKPLAEYAGTKYALACSAFSAICFCSSSFFFLAYSVSNSSTASRAN